MKKNEIMLLCLDKKYNLYLNSYELMQRIELMDVIDSLLYLLKSYGVEDEEIIDTIKSDADMEIEESE